MKKVELHEKKRVFDDFFKIDQAVLQFEKYNGQMSPPVKRLNFERGDAVAVLIFNSDSHKIILVEQFRFPTYEKTGGWLTEVVAGILGKDELPEDCARREVLEETGYRVKTLVPISTFYTTPGGSSERIFLYYAEVGGADKIDAGGGVDSEHEDIRIIEYSLPECRQHLDSGDFMDAKTLVALHWFALNINRE